MKRIKREETKFELIRMLDAYSRSKGVSIRDEANHGAFLSELLRKLETNKKNEILIHGLRTEAMFAYVAAAMGDCVAIKTEDAGNLYSIDSDLCIPDYRIVTSSGQELLVEVKNHHPSNPTHDFRMKKQYFDSLKRYAMIFNRELYFAIYWSQWNLWTLVRHDKFDVSKKAYGISFVNAMKGSEMRIIGDCLLGTVPYLELRLFSDPSSPRTIDADGTANFKIGTAQIFAGEKQVDNSLEQKIAWFLMNYGDWSGAPSRPEIYDDELISIGLVVAPEERANPGQEFEMIGYMSQMLSRQFNEITVGNEGVDLIPMSDPDELGVIIPSDYKGEELRLWRFNLQPSVQDSDE